MTVEMQNIVGSGDMFCGVTATQLFWNIYYSPVTGGVAGAIPVVALGLLLERWRRRG